MLIAHVAVVITVAIAGGHSPAIPPQGSTTSVDLYVSGAGHDSAAGTEAHPLRSLQRALDLAQPGATIHLLAGVYESAETRRAGTADAPITIRGIETGRDASRRFRSVIRGARIILQINHSYYRLSGFTVDGQPEIPPDTYPSTLSKARPFKDSVQARAVNSKLIYVAYAPESRDLTGIVLDDLFLHGAGGECVRFRNNAFGNVVVNSVIQWCGMAPSGDDKARYRYHNGEGVYIGTSPKSTSQPMAANDQSHDNEVRDSLIRTFGSECFQVKENAHHNRMLRVDCQDNDEPLEFSGSNVELRGDHNLIQDSTVSGSRGVNLKIASDAPAYDRGGNAVLRTRFSSADGAHVSFKSVRPAGLVCGNTFSTPQIFVKLSMGDMAAPCPSELRR
jgi:hypothetical protein